MVNRMIEDITLKDLRNALKIIKSEPLTKKEYEWGWVTYRSNGCIPVEIGLNKKTRELVLDLTKYHPKNNNKKLKGKLTMFDGIPIFICDK